MFAQTHNSAQIGIVRQRSRQPLLQRPHLSRSACHAQQYFQKQQPRCLIFHYKRCDKFYSWRALHKRSYGVRLIAQTRPYKIWKQVVFKVARLLPAIRYLRDSPCLSDAAADGHSARAVPEPHVKCHAHLIVHSVEAAPPRNHLMHFIHPSLSGNSTFYNPKELGFIASRAGSSSDLGTCLGPRLKNLELRRLARRAESSSAVAFFELTILDFK